MATSKDSGCSNVCPTNTVFAAAECDALYALSFNCADDFAGIAASSTAAGADGVTAACFAAISGMLPGNFPACYDGGCDLSAADSVCFECKQDVYESVTSATEASCSTGTIDTQGEADGDVAVDVDGTGETTSSGVVGSGEGKLTADVGQTDVSLQNEMIEYLIDIELCQCPGPFTSCASWITFNCNIMSLQFV